MMERFAVHAMAIHANPEKEHLQRSSRIHACLSQVPQFHSAGLASISIECSKLAICSAIVVGRVGDTAMLCPLNSVDAPPPRLVTLGRGKGAILRALSAGQAGTLRQWSGVFEDSTKFGANDAASASISMHSKAHADHIAGSQVVSSYGSIVLDVSHGGISLRAWNAADRVKTHQDSALIGEWRLPYDLSLDSICSTEHAIYGIGTANKNAVPVGAPELWRFDFPTELSLSVQKAQARPINGPTHQ